MNRISRIGLASMLCLLGCGSTEGTPSTSPPAQIKASPQQDRTSAQAALPGATKAAASIVLRPPATSKELENGAEVSADDAFVFAYHEVNGKIPAVELWNLKDPAASAIYPGLKEDEDRGLLYGFGWSPDHHYLYASKSYGVVVWDVQHAGKKVYEGYWVEGQSVPSPDGKRLLMIDQVGGVGVLDLSGETVKEPARARVYPNDAVTGITNESLFLTDDLAELGLLDGEVILVDGRTGKVKQKIPAVDQSEPLGVVSPSRKTFAYATPGGSLAVIDTRTTAHMYLRKPAKDMGNVASGFLRPAISADDKTLFSLTHEGNLEVWDLVTHKTSKKLDTAKTDCGTSEGALYASPTGHALVCTGQTASWFWDTEKGGTAKKLPSGTLQFEQGLLVIKNEKKDDQLFDVETGESKGARSGPLLTVVPGTDTRLIRSDGKSVHLRILHGSNAPLRLIYSDDGFFEGTDEVCQKVLMRADTNDKRPLTAEECAERRRPLLAELVGAPEHR